MYNIIMIIKKRKNVSVSLDIFMYESESCLPPLLQNPIQLKTHTSNLSNFWNSRTVEFEEAVMSGDKRGL